MVCFRSRVLPKILMCSKVGPLAGDWTMGCCTHLWIYWSIDEFIAKCSIRSETRAKSLSLRVTLWRASLARFLLLPGCPDLNSFPLSCLSTTMFLPLGQSNMHWILWTMSQIKRPLLNHRCQVFYPRNGKVTNTIDFVTWFCSQSPEAETQIKR